MIDCRQCRRFATIDTAGTGKDKAEALKGKHVSWSVVAVWDYWSNADLLFLRHVWRARVEWTDLWQNVLNTLRDWSCPQVRIENAHVGPALASQLSASGFAGDVRLVGPVLQGMAASGDGAKLDRAVAAGLIARLESGKFLIPQAAGWLSAYEAELTSWSGLPEETADQIDVSSYAAAECKRMVGHWGGVISAGGLRR